METDLHNILNYLDANHIKNIGLGCELLMLKGLGQRKYKSRRNSNQTRLKFSQNCLEKNSEGDLTNNL